MKKIACLILSAVLSPLCAHATVYTITATNQGWYQSDGYANTDPAGNRNYLTGISAGYGFRDVFVFDLSSLPGGSISSATLRLYNPTGAGDWGNGFNSPNPSELFEVGSVSTPISTINSAAGGVAVFNDLAAGTLWGSRSVSSSDDGSYVLVTLNSSFLSSAAPLLGLNEIAMGGHLQGDASFVQDDFIFGYTQNPANPTPELILNIVPEPSAWSLLSLGAGTFVAFRRRRRGTNF